MVLERPGEFTKCPCCDNPWNADVSGYAYVCAPCKTNAPSVGIGADLSASCDADIESV